MTNECARIRKRILEVSHLGHDGNLQSCFSSVEILYALYHGVMNWSVESAKSPDRDYFLLSKGQSSLALSVVLEDMGLFNPDEVNQFCKYGSRFAMQLDRTKFPEGGIENSAGSLGHGFPMAVGLAQACKIKGTGNHVYVLAGDGEMNEGTMWEACAFAGAHHLGNLTLIIDDNDSIGRMLDMSPLDGKLTSFGFEVCEADGHDVEGLLRALQSCDASDSSALASTALANAVSAGTMQNDIVPDGSEYAGFASSATAMGNDKSLKPHAVLAHTVRGYGSKTLMSDNAWFHKSPNEAELAMLKEEVDSFA